MITGTVNIHHEVVIRLPVQNRTGQEHEVETILDTGFTGSLTLPPAVVANLSLPWLSRENAILANGRIEQVDLHAAIVVWDGAMHHLVIQAVDNTPLLGMSLLIGFDLRVRVAVGGGVQIEPIP